MMMHHHHHRPIIFALVIFFVGCYYLQTTSSFLLLQQQQPQRYQRDNNNNNNNNIYRRRRRIMSQPSSSSPSLFSSSSSSSSSLLLFSKSSSTITSTTTTNNNNNDHNDTIKNNEYEFTTTTTTTTTNNNNNTTTTTSKSLVEEHQKEEDLLLLFDNVIWESYLHTLQMVMESKRVLKKDKLENMKEAVEYLQSPPVKIEKVSSNSNKDEEEGSTITTDDEETTTKSSDDIDLFCEKYNLSTSQYEFVVRCLVYMGDTCAKLMYNNSQSSSSSPQYPIVVAWHKLKEAKKILRENCISTFMYILGKETITTTNSNNNNNADIVVEDTLHDVATYHDNNFLPNEKTMTLRIKYLIRHSNIKQAEEILLFDDNNNNNNDKIKKLRTFVPLMEYYAFIKKDPYAILQLYCKMKNKQCCPGVYMDSEFYGLLLSSLARLQMFCSPPPITINKGSSSSSTTTKTKTTDHDDDDDDDDDEKQSSSSSSVVGFNLLQNIHGGPKLFDEIVSIMAEDILEMSENTAKLLYDGFHQGFGGDNDGGERNDIMEATTNITNNDQQQQNNSLMTSWSESIRQESSTMLSSKNNNKNLVTVGRVTIDDKTAICPTTGAKLRLFALDEGQRQHVQDTLLEMARIEYQEYNKKLKKKNNVKKGSSKDDDDALEDPDNGYRELKHFSQWLDSREGDPYTVIIDGPNVAYFGHPNVHYSQVQRFVEELESMGEHPLVTMPQKYTNKNFMVAGGRWQTLTDDDQKIIDSLVEQGKIFIVPHRCLDDYYWMLASVSNQTNSRASCDDKDYLRVPVNDQEGRFPGVRPMLVTCDQMRDHKMDLLEPREFRRWSSCHIVNYNISYPSPEAKQQNGNNYDVDFFPADFFSREIQGNLHSNGRGLVWHFPVAEWDESERFFIWIDQ